MQEKKISTLLMRENIWINKLKILGLNLYKPEKMLLQAENFSESRKKRTNLLLKCIEPCKSQQGHFQQFQHAVGSGNYSILQYNDIQNQLLV